MKKENKFINNLIFLVLITITIGLSIVIADNWIEDFDDKLDAYYSFQQTTGDIIDYKGNYSTSLFNVLRGAKGIYNAINLSSQDGYISIDTQDSFNELTINLWVYKDDFGVTALPSTDELWFTRWTDRTGEENRDILIRNQGSGVSFYIQRNGSIGEVFIGDGNITDSGWNMFTFWYNGSQSATYLNGTRLSEFNFASNLPTQNNGNFSVIIGDHTTNATFDEIGWWSRALSDSEILEIYNNGTEKIQNSAGVNIPSNNTISSNLSWIFNITFFPDLGESITNATIEIWGLNGSLRYKEYKAMSGTTRNSTTWNITSTNIDTEFLWNVKGEFDTGTGTEIRWGENNRTGFNNPKIKLTIINGAGTLINPRIYIQNISYSSINNPMDDLYLSDWGGNYNHSIQIEDRDFIHRNITINLNPYLNKEYTTTLVPNRLTLLFDQDGSPRLVNGSIGDLNSTTGFEDTSLLLVQTNLTEGQVKVSFGTNQLGDGNHTQFYEYINDLTTNRTETIEILDKADTTTYFKVISKTGIPLQDAEVILKSSETILGQANYDFISQRLTDTQGYTFVYSDRGEKSIIQVRKEGYQIKNILHILSDEPDAFTKDGAITIELEESDSTLEWGTWVYVQKRYNNLSDEIKGTIIDLDSDDIKINTDYRISKGDANITLTGDEYSYYDFTLQEGEDYDKGEDITLSIFIDNKLWNNINIEYDKNQKKDILNFPDLDLDDKIALPLGVIALIFISFITGTMFKGAGKDTFFIGSIILMLISNGFMWLSLTSVTYYGLVALRRVIEE